MINIIARKTLLDYSKAYPEAAAALYEWYHEQIKADFEHFNDLKMAYPSASLVGDDRVVFNIMGNAFRLVVRVVFMYKTIQVKWFGPHSEYDKLNVAKVAYKKK